MVPVTALSNTSNTQTGLTLEELTPTQNSQICQEILEEIFNTIVYCSEGGSHRPTSDLTSCFSPTCSLSGLDPLLDLATAVATLVSTNCRYQMKVSFNCSGCLKILRNTTHCLCGQPRNSLGCSLNGPLRGVSCSLLK